MRGKCVQRAGFKCNPCGKMLKLKERMMIHMRAEHVGRIFNVIFVEQRLGSIERIEKHMRRKHG